MNVPFLVVVAMVRMAVVIINLATKAEKVGAVSRTSDGLREGQPSLAVREAEAEPWKRRQLKHRHDLTRVCVYLAVPLDDLRRCVPWRRGFVGASCRIASRCVAEATAAAGV